MAYQRILVATDFSPTAEKAVAQAGEMARRWGAHLTVIHVIEHYPEGLAVAFTGREDLDPRTHLLDVASRRLADSVEKLGVRSASRHVMLSSRSARHEIIDTAARLKADLIVLGAPPRGTFAHMGSTASALLHTAPCDLLVVRGPA